FSISGVTVTRQSASATAQFGDVVVTTYVRDASNNTVTSPVPAGTVVHDEARVTKTAGTSAGVPNPTGTVDFTLYDNGTCTGTVLATAANKPLVSGVASSALFTTPGAGGTFSYRAHYDGDTNYPARDAGCESFTVTPDAAHQLQALLAAVTGVAPGTSLVDKV